MQKNGRIPFLLVFELLWPFVENWFNLSIHHTSLIQLSAVTTQRDDLLHPPNTGLKEPDTSVPISLEQTFVSPSVLTHQPFGDKQTTNPSSLTTFQDAFLLQLPRLQ